MTPVIFAQMGDAVPYADQGFKGNSDYGKGHNKPVVPEPATYGLLLVGLVVVVVLGRRLAAYGLTRMPWWKP